MGLGDKCRHTGIVREEIRNKGSKSEHTALVLDTGAGVTMKLRLKGGNPFREPALEHLLGQRVSIDGVAGSGVPDLFIDSVKDITVLGPPGRPRGPKGPGR